jgi:hypothetical protein
VVEFYHDVNGGSVIGVNWRLNGEQKFKVGLGASSIPVAKKQKKGGDVVEINRAGIMAEMRKMGDGLVIE